MELRRLRKHRSNLTSLLVSEIKEQKLREVQGWPAATQHVAPPLLGGVHCLVAEKESRMEQSQSEERDSVS